MNTTTDQLKGTIKEIVQQVLTENHLGSSPEFEEYVAEREAGAIVEMIARKNLRLGKVLRMQKDFALKKRKNPTKNAKGSSSVSIPETELKIDKNE